MAVGIGLCGVLMVAAAGCGGGHRDPATVDPCTLLTPDEATAVGLVGTSATRFTDANGTGCTWSVQHRPDAGLGDELPAQLRLRAGRLDDVVAPFRATVHPDEIAGHRAASTTGRCAIFVEVAPTTTLSVLITHTTCDQGRAAAESATRHVDG